DDDAVGALTGDGDFLGARAVQTTTHDLDRLIDGGGAHAVQSGLGEGVTDAAAAQLGRHAVGLTGRADALLSHGAQGVEGRVIGGALGDGDDDPARLALHADDVDLVFAQRDAD